MKLRYVVNVLLYNWSFWIIAGFIVFLGIWRLPCPQSREFMASLFRIGAIILLAYATWKYSNKWIALFLLSTLIPQFILAGNMQALEIKGQLYFPDMDSFITSINVIFGILWFFCLTSIIKNSKKIDNYILNAICIIALVHVINLFIYKEIGLTTSPNEASILLALTFPAFLRKKWWVLIFVVIVGLCMCKSNVGVVCSIFGGLTYIFLTQKKSIFLISCLTMIGVYFLYIKYIDIPTIYQRLKVWIELIKAYKDKWIFGYGFAGLKWHTQKSQIFRNIDSNGQIWWYSANNEFIHGLFEKGLFFIVPIIGYLINSLKRIVKYQPIIPTVAFVIILIASCCTYVFHIGTNAMLALLWLAILERQFNQKEEENSEKDSCFNVIRHDFINNSKTLL